MFVCIVDWAETMTRQWHAGKGEVDRVFQRAQTGQEQVATVGSEEHRAHNLLNADAMNANN